MYRQIQTRNVQANITITWIMATAVGMLKAKGIDHFFPLHGTIIDSELSGLLALPIPASPSSGEFVVLVGCVV